MAKKEVASNIYTKKGAKGDNKTSRIRDFWNKFKVQKKGVISGIFILFLLLIILLGPIIAPYDSSETDYEAILAGPSLDHWAGADSLGRDVFSRLIIGARISMFVGLGSVLIGAILGTILGLISGFFGKWIDNLIMRTCDVLFSFPDMILAIGIIALLGPGLMNVVIAISIFSTPQFARIVRSVTLETKTNLYIESSQAIGATRSRILFKHILPSTFPSIIVYFTMRIGSAIIIAASLSFLGLGAQPPSPDWGAMLSKGKEVLELAPHVTIFPGLAIFITVLAFNFFGDSLRDVLDPKIEE